MMVKHRVRHLPVTDGGRLIGFPFSPRLARLDTLASKPADRRELVS
jgi:CBS domain-containing protein